MAGVRTEHTATSHLEIDISRMFSQHPHHVSEALVDGDVERRAHGVVQEVDICPLTQQQPRDLRLITGPKQTQINPHLIVHISVNYINSKLGDNK